MDGALRLYFDNGGADLSNIINSIPIDYDDADSYKYWIREKYPLDRGWIYFQDIFKKAKVNR